MQCVDCHFDADVHGNGMLYGESRAATTIECIDCHGTINQRPTLITSGNGGQIDLNAKRRRRGGRALSGTATNFSTLDDEPRRALGNSADHRHDRPDFAALQCQVRLRQNSAARRRQPGAMCRPATECPRNLAHDNSNISCQICHTSWATSCFGCHLPMKANQRVPLNKYEGITTRNYTSYNPQVVRDDVFMLGLDGTVKSNRLAVIRSSSAVRGQFAKRKSRMGLFAAANGFRRRLQRPGVQSAFSAHHQRRRHDQKLHRLPLLRRKTTTTPSWRNCSASAPAR